MVAKDVLQHLILIGDVHTEATRLAHVLAHAARTRPDAVLCVGDIVDGPEDATRCIELLRDHGVLTVRGNHDRCQLAGTPFAPFEAPASAWDWLRALPATRLLDTVAGRLLLGHGVGEHDLTKLSPADILALQEESHALQARGIPDVTEHGAGLNEPLSMAKLIHLQREVSSHVEEFLKKKQFTFTEFTPTLLIERDPKDQQRLIDYEFLPPFDGKGLLYLFATLLRRVRLPIEQCPRCQQIFLKPRKDAQFCSRDCQSLAYAKSQRGDRPPKKRGRPRKHPAPQSQGNMSDKKGG